MAKIICEYGTQNKIGHIVCNIINDTCKYIAYCSQDCKYWCTNNYYNCERRKSEMGKKNKNYTRAIDSIEENFSTDDIAQVEQEVDTTILETPIQEEIIETTEKTDEIKDRPIIYSFKNLKF